MGALDGEVALVTGSSRGIGAAIARRFAREGASLAVHGRDQAALDVVRAELEQGGARAAAFMADVTRADEVERMVNGVEEALGPIDILVANAGGSPVPPGPAEEIDEAGWRAAVDANLTATFLTIKAVLPGMKRRRRGRIVTMSSLAGHRPHPRSPVPYAAAKAGIEMLTRDLAMQAGPYGVRVNAIAPETILTERNRRQIPEQLQRELAERHPLRRLGTPDDVAGAALFLVSEDSAWITGVVLVVDGGGMPVG